MNTTRITPVTFALLVLFAACGDSPSPINIDPSTCKPNAEAPPKDCDIKSLPEVDEDGRVTSQAGVEAICQSRCTRAADLRINGVPGLRDLNGFVGIKSVERDLTIETNPQLETLKGLDLQNPPLNIRIQRNPQLTSLEGLSNIERVGLRIRIADNPKLTNLKGLRNLRGFEDAVASIGGIILNRNGLESLEGLENLSMDGGRLYIQTERDLKSLDGLGDLGELYSLQISNNNALTDVNGLSGLTKTRRTFNITDNSDLPSCLAEAILKKTDTTQDTDVQISGNGGYDYPVCDDAN